MSKITLLLLGLFAAFPALSQNAIPNASFEDWVEESVLFTAYEDPVGWGTSNNATATFGIVTATKSTAPGTTQSGDASLRLETQFLSILDLPIQGGVATSELEIDLASQSVQAIGGVPYDLRPANLQGWYHYLPSNSDSMRIGMLLRRWNAETGTRDTVAIALLETVEETQGMSFFEVPFTYQSDLDPDTMLLGILCSRVQNPSIGSVLYVDDLSVTFPVTDVTEFVPESFRIFPNPTSGDISIKADRQGLLQVFDNRGCLVKSRRIDSGLSRLSLHDLPSGVYTACYDGPETIGLQRTKVVVVR